MRILEQGRQPPQADVPIELVGNRHLEEKFLYAAWAHGMREGEAIHRFALFGFIQTHLYAHVEPSLQCRLENSPNWDAQGKGVYGLNAPGLSRMLTLLGQPASRHSTTFSDHLETQFAGHLFSLVLDPVTATLSWEVNGKPVEDGGVVWHTLSTLGACDPRKKPRHKGSEAWRWLINTKGFTWKRFNAHE
jgi:hypothetical protein